MRPRTTTVPARVAGAVGRERPQRAELDTPRPTCDGLSRSAPADRRATIGTVTADLRFFACTQQISLTVTAAQIVLILPLAGSVDICAGANVISCTPDQPVLLARDGTISTIWSDASRGLVIQLRRERVQAVASDKLGDARRLGGVITALAADAVQRDAIVGRIMHVMARPAGLTPDDRAIEAEFYDALVGLLRQCADPVATFPLVRSITQTMRYIKAHPHEACDIDSLAAVAGVTALTLRKGFRSSLGKTVTQCVQAVRLDRAFTCLASNSDSRSVHALALEAGFKDGSSFSRAYVRQFGETPSETRIRATKNVLSE
ncbi:AraC family transcriptional regulator [Sphingomonas sp. PB4P5]|uniref:AraC family transcriptional regulator n=1 Tax=Parasphingomonas puruogangriensis TaxID=3096155 RepID=UPI002FCC1CF7